MSSTALEGVLEELRDELQDESAELDRTYQVWVISAGAGRLADARFAEQLHHQVRGASGLTYVCSSTNATGEQEIDEIGNRAFAERIAEAARQLGAGEARLLVVLARQVIALWDPEHARLAIALSAEGTLASGSVLDERSFEALLGQVPVEVVMDPQMPIPASQPEAWLGQVPVEAVADLPLRDKDNWKPAGRRAAKGREAAKEREAAFV
jgi:hypothetical protein